MENSPVTTVRAKMRLESVINDNNGTSVRLSAEITAAFEAWEAGYRGDPETFMTAEEAAAFSVAEISEQRSIYFVALLRTIQKGASA